MIHMTPAERGFMRKSHEQRRDQQLQDLAEEVRDLVNEKMPDIVTLVIGREIDQNMDDDQIYWSHLSLLTMRFYAGMAEECFYPAISFGDEWHGSK